MSQSRLANYGIAAASLVLAVLLRWILDPLLGDHLPLITIFAAVAVAVWVGGYRLALLVAVAGYLLCNYLFLEPRRTLNIGEARNIAEFVGFFAVCFIIVGFGEALRTTCDQLIELGKKRASSSPFVLEIDRIRQRHNLRDLGAIGFLVLAALLLAGGALGYFNTQRLARNEDAVTHTHEVITALENVLSTVKDAETGQRGYLLTGDDKYLAPYTQAKSSLNEQIAAVRKQIRDNSAQAARLDSLEKTIADKLAELEKTIDTMKSGNQDSAVGIVHTDLGMKLMDDARRKVDEMKNAEMELLAVRAAESKSSYEISLLSMVLSTVLALFLVGIVAYLTQRNALQRRESALQFAEQAERLRTTLASIGDAVITTDKRGSITHMNPVAESLTGWRTVEAAGRRLETVFHIVNESTGAVVENPVSRVLRDGVIVGLANHTALIAKDGNVRPIDDSAAPIICAEGEIVGAVLIFRDITERRGIERQLDERLSAARFLASIVESSHDAIISKTLEGIIQSWNAAAEEMFGYTAHEAVGKHISLVIPKERIGEEDRIIAKLRAGERIDHFDTVRVRSDGRLVHVSLTVSPMRDESGRIVGASKVVRDISDRVAAEQAIKSQNERLRLLSEAANVLLSTSDTDSLLHGLFDKIGPYFGVDAFFNYMVTESGDAMNLAAFGGVPEDAMTQLRRIELGRAISGTVALNRKPIHATHIQNSTDPLFEIVKSFGLRAYVCHPLTADNLLLGTLSFGTRNRDEFNEDDLVILETISHYVSVTYERLRLLNKLREADRRKDEFLATLAHELRNPLAPLRNILEIMKRTDSAGQILEQAHETMERQVEQLVRLVDDLMDVSRITRNKLELRQSRLELAAVVQNALDSCRPLAKSANLEIEVSLPGDPIYLDADFVRLSQVFSNLLNNACKYTEPDGKIWLTAQREGSDVKVSIKDTGMGIPTDKLGGIFEMFSQIEGSLERSQGGLGIGLTLVKRLVEMHSGTIEARSEGPGRGSEFIVRLPIVVDAPRERSNQSSGKLDHGPSRRILVVDDNPDSATSLATLLRIAGHETHVAHDGREAVEATERLRPDVVLLDIGLPRLNGYEACREIRRQPWGREMVLVAVTGWGQESDRDKSKEAGFDHHLVKPVDFASLTNVMASGRTSSH